MSFPQRTVGSDRVTYTSHQAVLGQLHAKYDFQRERRTIVDYDPETDFDQTLVIRGYETHIDEAKILRDRYNHDLRAIMDKYDIKNEFEALTGDVLRVSRKLRRNHLADIRLQIRREVNELLKSYRVAFDQESLQDLGTSSPRLRMASAWYCVTYSPQLRPELAKSHRRRRELKPFLSFPWILYNYLCEIKKNSVSAGHFRRV